jgi:hypothetical protein
MGAMISPLDNFALTFDSFTPPQRGPGEPSPFDDPFAYGGVKSADGDPLGALTAWEQSAPPAPAPIAPNPTAPGFYLIDDCGGRFAIEREFGVISLADESLATRESGAIHAARVRVIEQSGDSYEQILRLKITGLVPQLAGAEDLDVGGDIAEAPAPRIGWTRYAAFASTGAAPQALGAETAAFGALLDPPAPAPAALDAAALALGAAPPAPAREDAWTSLTLH